MPETEEVNLDELTGDEREDALFGGGPGSEAAKDDPPEETEEVLEAADDDELDEEIDEELDDEEAEEEAERAESLYSKMQAKMQESRRKEPEPPADGGTDARYAEIANKALDALNAAKQPAAAPEPKEETKDWTQDPQVVAAYRESYPNLDDEDIARLMRQQQVVSSHETQQALERELGPMKKEFESFKQTDAQRQAMGQLQAGFQGTLQSVAQKSAVHSYVAQHYNQDMPNSLLGAELTQIGAESPETLMGILRSPKALSKVIDGIVFDIESNYGNLEDEGEDAQVESSTVARTRSPRRQQKRNQKPSTEEAEADLRRETFGDSQPLAQMDFMKPTQHSGT